MGRVRWGWMVVLSIRSPISSKETCLVVTILTWSLSCIQLFIHSIMSAECLLHSGTGLGKSIIPGTPRFIRSTVVVLLSSHHPHWHPTLVLFSVQGWAAYGQCPHAMYSSIFPTAYVVAHTLHVGGAQTRLQTRAGCGQDVPLTGWWCNISQADLGPAAFCLACEEVQGGLWAWEPQEPTAGVRWTERESFNTLLGK